MKNHITLLILFALSVGCNKDIDNSVPTTGPFEHYSSVEDFFARNSPPMQTYIVSGVLGDSITTPNGTTILIPQNAFVTPNNLPVTGDVTISFKDIYKKSDMLLANVPTVTYNNFPMVSAGEFFIKAVNQSSIPLKMATGKKIDVIQMTTTPGAAPTFNMIPLNGTRDSLNNFFWEEDFINSLTDAASIYIYSFYSFSTPLDSGTWCNSDDPYFFAAYPMSNLNVTQSDDVNQYQTQVFLIFTGINSMIHLYDSPILQNTFNYNYAPEGFECTIVAIGEKDGDLYSAFIPTTITSNQTVNFTLTKTTSTDFKAQIIALN